MCLIAENSLLNVEIKPMEKDRYCITILVDTCDTFAAVTCRPILLTTLFNHHNFLLCKQKVTP